MKRIIIILFIIMLFISCSKENNNEITEVVFWHVMGGPVGDVLKSLIDSFNTLNPDINIIPISVGNYNALSQKLMASSSNPPVISQMYESWTMELYKAGKLEPIENLMSEEQKKDINEDIFEIFIKDNTFNGILVSMPFNKSVPAYFYNIDRFKEFNIDKFPQTWEQFLKTMKALTIDENNDSKPEYYGTAFNINTWMFESRLFQFNGYLVNDDLTPAFNSPAAIKAINIDLQMLNKDKSAYLTTGYQHQDDFIAGKIATIFGSCVSLSFILNAEPPFKLGVAPIPYGDEKAVLISGTNVSIFSKASEKQKQAAYKFIMWFTSPEIQAIWSSKTGYLPVRKSSLENKLLKEQFEKFSGLKDVYLQLDYAYMEPQDNIWYLGRQMISRALEYIIKANQDPEKVLNKIAKEYEIELKKSIRTE